MMILKPYQPWTQNDNPVTVSSDLSIKPRFDSPEVYD